MSAKKCTKRQSVFQNSLRETTKSTHLEAYINIVLKIWTLSTAWVSVQFLSLSLSRSHSSLCFAFVVFFSFSESAYCLIYFLKIDFLEATWNKEMKYKYKRFSRASTSDTLILR